MKLKKGDSVKIIKGKEKGKTGVIDRVFPKSDRIFIAGINEYKRHMKGRGDGRASEIITIAKPLASENVQLVCPKCHLQTRLGYSYENNKKIRICRKCEQAI